MSPMVLALLASLTTAAPDAASKVIPVTQVSPNGVGNCRAPVWSADGTKLAFERVFLQEQRIELHLVEDLSQQTTRRLKNDQPADTAKGLERFKSKTSLRSGDVCLDPAFPVLGPDDGLVYTCSNDSRLSLYVREGEKPPKIMTPNGTAGQPAFSPTTTNLAFVWAKATPGKIYLLENVVKDNPAEELRARYHNGPQAKNAQAKQKANDGRESLQLNPQWSPDGKKILYTSFSPGKGGDLYIFEVDGRQEPIQLTKTPGDEFNATWSPDGTRVAFYRAETGATLAATSFSPTVKVGIDAEPEYGIYIVELGKKKRPYRVSDKAIVARRGPAWTPDAKYIVYASTIDDDESLWAAEAKERGGKIRLPTRTVSNRDPVVSLRKTEDHPAGAWQVAFTSLGEKGISDHLFRRVYVAPLTALQDGKLETKWKAKTR